MKNDPEGQTEFEIQAFVNGQLDGERRYSVMEYLSQHPDRAAEVMADLRLTEGLRLTFASVATPLPVPLLSVAERFATPRRRVAYRQWLGIAAGVALFAIGWQMPGVVQYWQTKGRIAEVLDVALDARDAVRLRASLVNELGPMPTDPVGIANRLGIELPALPLGWSIRAAQVVATPERPGLALIIDTPDMGEVLLFGVIRSDDGPDGPARVASRDGRALAFFERQRTAFVLVDASGDPSKLRLGAEALRNRFN